MGTQKGKQISKEEDDERYARQVPLWGSVKQENLKKANVFIAGAGGTGSAASIYLAIAGIGKISICDFNVIEIANLNRQILHYDTRIGKSKAFSAKATLEKINKNVEVIPLHEKINKSNVADLIGDCDIILDCLDNFETRYILNEYAVRKKIPLVLGVIYGTEGQVSFIQHPETFCLACIFEETPPNEVFPVIGATHGVVGTLQAMEVIKYLTDTGENLKNYLLIWDGLKQDFRKVQIVKDPSCEVCSKERD